MPNVQTELKGDKLILTIDVSKKAVEAAQPSSSGKVYLVASSQGKVPGRDDLTLGLNLYTKNGKK